MKKKKNTKPTRQEAEAAVKTLLSFVGEDANRPGLLETPKRVVKAYEDWFSGYNDDPKEVLKKTFDELEVMMKLLCYATLGLSRTASTTLPLLSAPHMLPTFQIKE